MGELRFKRATEPAAWEGVKECKVMGPGPIQFADGMMLDMSSNKNHPKSEDCLYLNVRAPKDAKNAPVFVWIYGGANSVGEASEDSYDLTSFAMDGVIGVSFNYRLGPLGFYDFSKLDDRFESNCAASDMIAALKWVHENIEEFGGDPNNVTICGESAGGTGVYSMLSAPSAKDYFQKAIAQSGLAGNVTSYHTHELNNNLFFEQLGITANEVSKLLDMPASDMVAAAAYVLNKNNEPYPGIMVTGMVIDDLIPEAPWDALAHGSANGKKCIFGTCRDEGNLFYNMNMIPKTWADIEKMCQLGGYPDLINTLKSTYGNLPEKEAAQKIGRERLFWADSIKCSIAQSEKGEVYSYRYDFVPFFAKITKLSATHGTDTGTGLDTYTGSVNTMNKFTSKKRLKRIHGFFHGAFVDFCKTGKPDANLPIEWKPYKDNERFTLLFNDNLSSVNNPNKEYFEAWKDIVLYDK